MSGLPSRDHSPIEDPNRVAFNAIHSQQRVKRHQVIMNGKNISQSPNRLSSKPTLEEKVSQKTLGTIQGRFTGKNLQKQLTQDRSSKRIETKIISDKSGNASPLVCRRNENNKSATRLPLGQQMSRFGSKSQIQLQNGGSNYQKAISRNYQVNNDRSKAQNDGQKGDQMKQSQGNVFNQKRVLDESYGMHDTVNDERSNNNRSGVYNNDQANQLEALSNHNVKQSHITQFRKTISPLNCGQSKTFMTKKDSVLVSTQSQSKLICINNIYNQHIAPKKVKTEVQTPSLTLSHQRSNSVSQMNQIIHVSSRFQNLKKRYSEGKRDDSLNGISTDGKSGNAAYPCQNDQWPNNYDDSVDILQNTPTNNQQSKQHSLKMQASHSNLQQKEQLIVNLTGLKSFNKNQTQQKTSRIPQITQTNWIPSKQQVAGAKRIKVDLGLENQPKSQFQLMNPRQTLPQQQKIIKNDSTQNCQDNERLSEAKRQQIQRKNYHAYFDMYKSSSASGHKDKYFVQETQKNQQQAQLSQTNLAVNTMPTASTPISSIYDQKCEIQENDKPLFGDALLIKEEFCDSNTNRTSQLQDFAQFDTFSRKSVSKTTEKCHTNNNANSNTKNLEHEFNNFMHQENLSMQSKGAISDINHKKPFDTEIGTHFKGNLNGQSTNIKSKYLQQMAANEYNYGATKATALRQRPNRVYSYQEHNQNENFQSQANFSQNDAQNNGDLPKVTNNKFTSNCSNHQQLPQNRLSISSGLSMSKNEPKALQGPANFSQQKREPAKRQESKMNSHRILMRRQQCRSPQILKAKRGADLNEVNRSQNFAESAFGTSAEFGDNWKTRGIEGSPMQAAQSHRNLHERHNSKIGKGIYKQRSGNICQNILQGQSIVPKINKVNSQNHIKGDESKHQIENKSNVVLQDQDNNIEGLLQPRDEYKSRISISSRSNGVTSNCAPGPHTNGFIKNTRCLSNKGGSHGVEDYHEDGEVQQIQNICDYSEAQVFEAGEQNTRKSFEQLSRQSIIQVYNKNMQRDSQGRSSSIKKSLRADRCSRQFDINESSCYNNPIPQQVSPKPISSSPNMFHFRENPSQTHEQVDEDVENTMSLEPRQFDQRQASITSPVKAFDYQSSDIGIRQSSEQQLSYLKSDCQKAVMMVLKSNDSRQMPLNNAPTPKPQDQLPTPFCSKQTLIQKDQQNTPENFQRKTSQVSSILDKDEAFSNNIEKQQSEPFKVVTEAKELQKIPSKIQSQNYSNIKRQSALLHDRYANRSRRNQESLKQPQTISRHSSTYETCSDRLKNNVLNHQQERSGDNLFQDQNELQRSQTKQQSQDSVLNKNQNQQQSAGKSSLLHRPRHHDQNIGSHYKDRAKRVKELHVEMDLNGEITFKQNRSNNDISTISEIKYEVENIQRQQIKTKALPVKIKTFEKIQPSEPQIITNQALKYARKSENVPVMCSQGQVLSGPNQFFQMQEKEEKLLSKIASLKQFKVDDSQSSSNFVREKRQYLVRSQLNEQAPETSQVVQPTYTPRNAQPQNILSEDSAHNELDDYSHHVTFSEKPNTLGTGMKQRAVSQIMIFEKAAEGDDWSNQDTKKIESTSTTTATTGNVVQKTERKTRKERAQRKAAGSNNKTGAAHGHSDKIVDLTYNNQYLKQSSPSLLRNSIDQSYKNQMGNQSDHVQRQIGIINDSEALLAQSSQNLREFAKNY